MALEMLVTEACDLSEDAIMEVIHFIWEFKMKTQHPEAVLPLMDHPVIREAGKYRGQIFISDDFDEF